MPQAQITAQYKWLYLFIGLAALVNFSGLFIPIMGPDGALYALLAKTMVIRHDYINLYYHGADWLDKPHFPFWITAISFNLFGFTTWAYKLPGILFILMGAGYTYKFAKAVYNKEIALWSVLILLTAEHIVLSDNDVRAEPYLTGLIIAAVYHLYCAYQNNSFWQLLAGCIFTACAIMTKGMFAIVPIGGAIAGHFIITKQWKALFSFRSLLGIILVMIFILPELWCLNKQFDLHPEKVIFGQKGVSGIRFFFWDSQFGRFFNTGPIKGSGDPFFFVHTVLWAFLPWSLLLFAAVFQYIKASSKNVKAHEWFCISGALLTFLLFSASKFQLPHYLNIVFPFFAIITAQYVYYIKLHKTIRAVNTTQTIVIILLLLLVCVLQYFFRPAVFSLYTALTLAVLFLMMVIFPDEMGHSINHKIIYRSVLASFIINLYLNLSFYPSLMKYQAASEAAMFINQNNKQNIPVVVLGDDYVTAFEFYINKPITKIDAAGKGQLPAKPFMLYAPADVISSLNSKGWQTKPLSTYERYWVSRLKPAFLNKYTRVKELTTTEVALVN
ncbi:dolichyl-phosphate-mannose-protein mannosyltransferase [Mucilaginibacter frigoritolerans]|uniref:Dolichyl-phosphate-mannose-protein mannosyltransferase n=1 Tax=Mucilaginibacter frigoritolerans TaxID=652788 RepID=A0A562U7L1_9SPHI|nr:glycosyltransferase family 39 protein [Mucilaginibacter frigoritolerans]TWJ01569.1 dolichyl-phosphate-mannose-protein mannosyltransferase [Mucilaginibacter frigoritolerans]